MEIKLSLPNWWFSPDKDKLQDELESIAQSFSGVEQLVVKGCFGQLRKSIEILVESRKEARLDAGRCRRRYLKEKKLKEKYYKELKGK